MPSLDRELRSGDPSMNVGFAGSSLRPLKAWYPRKDLWGCHLTGVFCLLAFVLWRRDGSRRAGGGHRRGLLRSPAISGTLPLPPVPRGWVPVGRSHGALRRPPYTQIYISFWNGRGRGVVQQMASRLQVCQAEKGLGSASPDWPSVSHSSRVPGAELMGCHRVGFMPCFIFRAFSRHPDGQRSLYRQ